MDHRDSMSRGEAALERLLQRIDAAVDEYRRTRRSHRREPIPDEDAVEGTLDDHWEAWWALPLAIRDWLLWYVPGWWALPFGPFRRLLLTTARLIITHRLPPRLALRRAATRLRLPPPRPISRRGRIAGRFAPQQFRAAARRNQRTAQATPRPSRRQFRAPAPRPRRRTASVQRAWAARNMRAPAQRASGVSGRVRRLPPRRFGGGTQPMSRR
jgi:hypothetical protein